MVCFHSRDGLIPRTFIYLFFSLWPVTREFNFDNATKATVKIFETKGGSTLRIMSALVERLCLGQQKKGILQDCQACFSWQLVFLQ